MELLYLWIEKYKNIEKQGFNFSPLYDFKYDEDTKELSVDKKGNEDFYKDFFKLEEILDTSSDGSEQLGKITNVTAIIGENGSGKSSVLEGVFNKDIEAIRIFKTEMNLFVVIHSDKITITNNYLDKGTFEVFKKKEFDQLVKEFNEEEKKKYKINALYYNNIMEGNTKSISMIDKVDNLSLYYRLYEHEERYQHNFEMYSFFNQCTLIEYIKNKKNYTFPFDLPNRVLLKINYNKIKSFFGTTDNKGSYLKFPANPPPNDNWKNLGSGNHFTSNFIKYVKWAMFYSLFTGDSFSTNFLNYNEMHTERREKIDKLLSEIPENVSDDEIISLGCQVLRDYFSSSYKDNVTLPNEYQKIDEVESTMKDILTILEENIFKLNKNTLIHNLIDFDILVNLVKKIKELKLVSPLDFSWEKDDTEFYFSSGENALLSLLATIYNSEGRNSNDNDINVLIDEGELGLHPQWQKKYLNTLLDVLPQLFPTQNIQLILTSHSPFLASDLPKENIIFLEKGDGGKCEVADLANQQRTFGQNIFELFADSFFVQDGLIGKFADNKIKAIATKLSELKLKVEKEESITSKELNQLIDEIDMIGDDFIRFKFNEYYASIITALDNSPKSRRQKLLSELKEVEDKAKNIRNKLSKSNDKEDL
ncbi:AAA family ATPase [Bernardetia sp. OM2101]|uniref:AAA family ATPase n=1 Tax=Bernardetia sp. OM2101 TaxID=3344876 RepID=UPI0035D0DF66